MVEIIADAFVGDHAVAVKGGTHVSVVCDGLQFSCDSARLLTGRIGADFVCEVLYQSVAVRPNGLCILTACHAAEIDPKTCGAVGGNVGELHPNEAQALCIVGFDFIGEGFSLGGVEGHCTGGSLLDLDQYGHLRKGIVRIIMYENTAALCCDFVQPSPAVFGKHTAFGADEKRIVLDLCLLLLAQCVISRACLCICTAENQSFHLRDLSVDAEAFHHGGFHRSVNFIVFYRQTVFFDPDSTESGHISGSVGTGELEDVGIQIVCAHLSACLCTCGAGHHVDRAGGIDGVVEAFAVDGFRVDGLTAEGTVLQVVGVAHDVIVSLNNKVNAQFVQLADEQLSQGCQLGSVSAGGIGTLVHTENDPRTVRVCDILLQPAHLLSRQTLGIVLCGVQNDDMGIAVIEAVVAVSCIEIVEEGAVLFALCGDKGHGIQGVGGAEQEFLPAGSATAATDKVAAVEKESGIGNHGTGCRQSVCCGLCPCQIGGFRVGNTEEGEALCGGRGGEGAQIGAVAVTRDTIVVGGAFGKTCHRDLVTLACSHGGVAAGVGKGGVGVQQESHGLPTGIVPAKAHACAVIPLEYSRQTADGGVGKGAVGEDGVLFAAVHSPYHIHIPADILVGGSVQKGLCRNRSTLLCVGKGSGLVVQREVFAGQIFRKAAVVKAVIAVDSADILGCGSPFDGDGTAVNHILSEGNTVDITADAACMGNGALNAVVGTNGDVGFYKAGFDGAGCAVSGNAADLGAVSTRTGAADQVAGKDAIADGGVDIIGAGVHNGNAAGLGQVGGIYQGIQNHTVGNYASVSVVADNDSRTGVTAGGKSLSRDAGRLEYQIFHRARVNADEGNTVVGILRSCRGVLDGKIAERVPLTVKDAAEAVNGGKVDAAHVQICGQYKVLPN